MRILRGLPAALTVFALLLAGCGQVAEMIPGDARDRPSPEEQEEIIASGPILVTPTVEIGAQVTSGDGAAAPDHELARTVVQVELLDATGTVVRSGSGVVIDTAERLILTSFPLVRPVEDDGSPAYHRIVIATNRNPGTAPQEEFEAVLADASPASDLAVLRVDADAAGEPLEEGAFDLPAVQVAAGADAGVGDPVRLFGHPDEDPGSGQAAPVAVTQASVARVRGEAGVEGRGWITTDARLPAGTQGGPAYRPDGRLLGVLVQPVYHPALPVSEVRPVDLAVGMVERARSAGEGERYAPPLMAQAAAVSGGVWVSRPSFALDAIDLPGGGNELFDYRHRFDAGTATIYYEFAAFGLEKGDAIEERWLREGVLQDQLSSSYPWELGPFGIVADRIRTPNPAGLPEGRWRLEIWVNEALRSSATVVVGDRAEPPVVEARDFGARATADGEPAEPPSSVAEQLLFFFDYEHMESARRIRWLVFRNARIVYQSPEVPWTGGDSGGWWVGYRDPEGLGPGTWEFELQVDGTVAVTESVTLP